MPDLTTPERYITAALRSAVYESIAGDLLGASIRKAPGVVAFGVDRDECTRNLRAQLAECVWVSLELGRPLPVLDGVALNESTTALLATHLAAGGDTRRMTFMETAEDFDRAFAERYPTD